MPKRTDISKILIIGFRPIVIANPRVRLLGNTGVQGAPVGSYEVVLANSNRRPIMTDPELADRTYIEPAHGDYLEEIIRRVGVLRGAKGSSRCCQPSAVRPH